LQEGTEKKEEREKFFVSGRNCCPNATGFVPVAVVTRRLWPRRQPGTVPRHLDQIIIWSMYLYVSHIRHIDDI
jgi:hypothetical protein